MRWFSIAAIYFLFWFMALFAVLPFGMRTSEEAGHRPEAGHAESAPHIFRPWPIVWRTSLVAAVMLAIFYYCYSQGWLDIKIAAGTTLQSGEIGK
jgi:predicted secreted protein